MVRFRQQISNFYCGKKNVCPIDFLEIYLYELKEKNGWL